MPTTIEKATIVKWSRVLERADAVAARFARKLARAAARQAAESGRLGYANAVHMALRQTTNAAWPYKFARFIELCTGARVVRQDHKGRLTVYRDPGQAAVRMTDPATFKATGDRFTWSENPEIKKTGLEKGRAWLRASGDNLDFDMVQAANMPNEESPAQKRLGAIIKVVKAASRSRQQWAGTEGYKELTECISILANAFPDLFE